MTGGGRVVFEKVGQRISWEGRLLRSGVSGGGGSESGLGSGGEGRWGC